MTPRDLPNPDEVDDTESVYKEWDSWAQSRGSNSFKMDEVFRDLLSAARKKKTITYGDLMSKYHLPRGGTAQQNGARKSVGWVVYVVGVLAAKRLGDFQLQLHSLAVRKSNDLPGPGFYGEDEDVKDAKDYQQACWGKIGALSEKDFQSLLKNLKLP